MLASKENSDSQIPEAFSIKNRGWGFPTHALGNKTQQYYVQ